MDGPHKHYQVVAAVVEYDNKILCVRKGVTRYDYTSNVFEFPGGKVEPNETEEEALKRELREEMDYDIEVKKHLVTVRHDYPDFSITLSAYICHPAGERDAFVLKEHTEYRWLTKDELDTLNWAEADKGILKEIKKLIVSLHVKR